MKLHQDLSFAEQLSAAFGVEMPDDISRLTLEAARKRCEEAMSIRDFDTAEKLLQHAYNLFPTQFQAVKIAKFYALNRRDPITAETWFQKAYRFTHSSSLAVEIGRFFEKTLGDEVAAGAWFGLSRRARNTERYIKLAQTEVVETEVAEPAQGEKIVEGWQEIVAHLNPER